MDHNFSPKTTREQSKTPHIFGLYFKSANVFGLYFKSENVFGLYQTKPKQTITAKKYSPYIIIYFVTIFFECKIFLVCVFYPVLYTYIHAYLYFYIFEPVVYLYINTLETYKTYKIKKKKKKNHLQRVNRVYRACTNLEKHKK